MEDVMPLKNSEEATLHCSIRRYNLATWKASVSIPN